MCGRVMAKRVMGKMAFLVLRDDRGQMQIYVDKVCAQVCVSLKSGVEMRAGAEGGRDKLLRMMYCQWYGWYGAMTRSAC